MDFRSLLIEKKYVLADFFADWCEPCKMLDEILKTVEIRWEKKITIIKIDVDTSERIATSFQVLSVPVLIFFKNGELVWRMNGFMSAADLIKTLEKFIDD